MIIGEQVPEGQEIKTAHKILGPPVCGEIEVGFMYRLQVKANVRLRIVDSTHKTWMPICGGMSQVIGKALIETSLREHCNIIPTVPVTAIRLLADSGIVPLEIKIGNGRSPKSDNGHIRLRRLSINKTGVEPVRVMDVDAMRVGYFMILKTDEIEKSYPDGEFAQRSPGSRLDILRWLHEAYIRERRIEDGLYSMLYDMNHEGPGQARLFSRFYDASGITTSMPWEFQCGTGTVAVGIAMAAQGELPFQGDAGTVVFEWGSQRWRPDPYGGRTTELNLKLQNDRVEGFGKTERVLSVGFSHSVIEVLCEGRLTLPDY